MSFVFNGLRSIAILSKTEAYTPSVVTNLQETQASRIHHSPTEHHMQDDVSSLDENDIVSDEEEEVDDEDGDDNNSIRTNQNSESDENGNTGTYNDNVSTITNVTRKKLDADIQLEVWNIGLEQLDSYICPCKKECTQNVPVGHVVHTRRSLYGQGNITALMRRKAIFNLLNRANIATSKEFRYVTVKYTVI